MSKIAGAYEFSDSRKTSMHKEMRMKPIFYRLSIIVFAIYTVIPFAYANGRITSETFNKYSEAAGFEKQYNQMINILVSSFQNGMIQGFEDGIKEKDISMEIKQKITPIVSQSAENIKINFEQLFNDEVKFKDLVNDVYLPIYRRHFTESEVIELIKFYKSPVGKKLSASSPTIMQESSTAFYQVYGFRVQKLGGELVKKEVDHLIEKVKSLKDSR